MIRLQRIVSLLLCAISAVPTTFASGDLRKPLLDHDSLDLRFRGKPVVTAKQNRGVIVEHSNSNPDDLSQFAVTDGPYSTKPLLKKERLALIAQANAGGEPAQLRLIEFILLHSPPWATTDLVKGSFRWQVVKNAQDHRLVPAYVFSSTDNSFIEKTYPGLITIMETKAEQGDLDAQLACAFYYHDRNDEKFFDWTRKAAKGGHALALYWLACAYRTDDDLYITHLEQASKLGLAKAQCALAMKLVDKRKPDQVFKLIEAAAKQGFAAAEYKMPTGGISDMARMYLERSADQEYHKALHEVGRCFNQGLLGWPVIFATAADYYKRAIQAARSVGADHKVAALALVSLYEKGSKDLPANPYLALKYLMISGDIVIGDIFRPDLVKKVLKATPAEAKATFKSSAKGFEALSDKTLLETYGRFLNSAKKIPGTADELLKDGFIHMPRSCLEMCVYMRKVADDLAQLWKLVTSSSMLVNIVGLCEDVYVKKDKETEGFVMSLGLDMGGGTYYQFVSVAEELPEVVRDLSFFIFPTKKEFTEASKLEIVEEITKFCCDHQTKAEPMQTNITRSSISWFIPYCEIFGAAFAETAIALNLKADGFKEALGMIGTTNEKCEAQLRLYEKANAQAEESAKFFAQLKDDAIAAFQVVRGAIVPFTFARNQKFLQDPANQVIVAALDLNLHLLAASGN